MLSSVLTVALIIVCLLQAALQTVHYVHVLQRHSYRNERYRKWMLADDKRTLPTARLFLSAVPLATMMVFGFEGTTGLIVTACACALGLIAAVIERPKPTKKPLVYTPRVRRLLATILLINGVLLGTAFAAPPVFNALRDRVLSMETGALTLGRAVPAMLILIVLMPVLLVQFANRLNAPIEKRIADGYTQDAKRILSEMSDLTVIGVTGSYGKTSVKSYLTALLSVKYSVLMTPESYNTPMGVVRTVRERLKPSHEIFVCEMGSRNRGDIRELCDIVHPHHGIITAIGEQHLETFQTVQAVADTQFELVDALPENGMAFLNVDNEYIAARDVRCVKVVSYGLCDGAVYTATDVVADENGSRFTVVAPDGDNCEYTTRLLGAHSIQNLLGCIAVANQLGITLRELRSPVRHLKPVEHRLQLLEDGYIDDTYNSNPDGFRAALDLIGAMTDVRRVLVTPGLLELGARQDLINQELGVYAASRCDWVVLVGETQTSAFRDGLLSQGFDEEHVFVAMDLHQALSFVRSLPETAHQVVLLENDPPELF